MTKVQSELTKQVLASIQGMQVIKSYNLAGENNEQLNKSINDTSEIFLELEKNVIPYIVIQKNCYEYYNGCYDIYFYLFKVSWSNVACRNCTHDYCQFYYL